MEAALPWAKLIAVIQPHYPTGRRGDGRARAEDGVKMNEPSRFKRWQRYSQAEQTRWR
ncbi:MAG: hypothetical protein BWX84_01285 [Verrucomicrobia bacterium ADurb.Bin118]|jgi:hypothetical protein|nr:MAG: hypothetical protein BWX84_01285 [Verrucomicrobia bacterium ADurb.Bin118]